MESLIQKEQAWPSGGWRAWSVTIAVGAVWLLLGAGDWLLRFTWYRWHERLVFRPAAAAAAEQHDADTFTTNWVPEVRGGDLVRLVGLASFAERFAQVRPAGSQVSDGAGYRNYPVPPGVVHPIAVVGDSFMAAGEPMTNMFAAKLAERAGQPVHNAAMEGVGPFLSLVQFVDSRRFLDRKPKVLVWGFVEREVIRHGFSGLLYQLDIREKGIVPPQHYALRAKKSGQSVLVNWPGLRPEALKQDLPNTSALAQRSRAWWDRLRYAIFGVISPDVIVSAGKADGQSLLFYRPALELTLGDPFERHPPQVTEAIVYARDFMARRGIELVVLLIPDKETIYWDLLPPHEQGGRTEPPSCLFELEELLRVQGIPVVNLLPVFRERAAAGRLLYWADDTHWNSEGIQLAVDETWAALQKLPGRGD